MAISYKQIMASLVHSLISAVYYSQVRIYYTFGNDFDCYGTIESVCESLNEIAQKKRAPTKIKAIIRIFVETGMFVIYSMFIKI